MKKQWINGVVLLLVLSEVVVAQQPVVSTVRCTARGSYNFQANNRDCALFDLGDITIKSLSISAAVYAVKTLMHECGHAIAAMLYDRDCVDGIHIFTHDVRAEPVISLGKLHVHAEHLGGVTVLKQGTSLPAGYQALFILGGGIAGSIFCYCALTGITSYCHYKDNQAIGSALVGGLKDSINPFACIIESKNLSLENKQKLLELSFVIAWAWILEVFYAFTPNAYASIFENRDQATRGDGEQFWQTVLHIHDPLLTVARVVSVVGEVGCLALLFKRFNEASNAI